MISKAVFTVLILRVFFPPILPVFLAYFFPKCISLLTNLSAMLTSALLNRFRAERPKVIGITTFFKEIAFFRPRSFISIFDMSHFLNKSKFCVCSKIISSVFLSYHGLVLVVMYHLLCIL